MKTKNTSMFGILSVLNKAFFFAEKGLETLSIQLENKVDRWTGKKSKNKRQEWINKREKERKKQLQMIAEEHQGFLEMQKETKTTPNTEKQIKERFEALEAQDKANENEDSLDVDVER
ncbi:MAG: hypothetical protein GKR88_14940 [Flavobacteriaceae bacterium]|nr:MAG: hypothetical protein GKR88_14940 [Flavobacteriaceae bacterium]